MRFFRVFTGFILGVLVSSFMFLMFEAGTIYDFKMDYLESDLDDADVILCLAGGPGRIAAAAKLWERALEIHGEKNLPILYLSGLGGSVKFSSLAETEMPETALKRIRESDMILESVSQNTYENGQLFKSFQRQLEWKKAILVTSDYHLKRSKAILGKIMGSKKDIPAVGVALGLDRILLMPGTENVQSKSQKKPKVFFVQLGLEAKLHSLSIVEMLRKAHIPMAQSLSKDSLGIQLGMAERLEVPYVIIFGQKEALENVVIVRNMKTHSQETVSVPEVVDYLKKLK